MTNRVRSADGTNIAVFEHGDPADPTIVCVHGWPDNHTMWDGVVAALQDRYHVVAYDLRGFGESDKPKARDAYRMDRLIEDLAAVIDAVSPGRPAHVLGHDWGAISSWHGVPEDALGGRIRSFTTVSGPNLDYVGHWARRHAFTSPGGLRAGLLQLSASVYAVGLFQTPGLPALAVRAGWVRAVADRVARQGNGSLANEVRTSASDEDTLNGVNLYRANILSHVLNPKPRRTRIPVLAIGARNDAAVQLPIQTEAPVGWVDDLRVRIVAGGHWVPAARPDVIAALVSEFVDSVESKQLPRTLAKAKVERGTKRRTFHGALVVVTGAGRGIGRETAMEFARQGADVVVADIDDPAAEQTADAIRGLGSEAWAYHLDVGDAAAFEQFAKDVKTEHGVPDVVVNNAGIGLAGSFLDTSVEDWQKILDVNLWSVIHGSRLFGAQMVERGHGGKIVNVASAAAWTPSRVMSAYATTKAAVLMLTECLRAELSRDGIGVIAICPGVINTGIVANTKHVGADAATQTELRDRTVGVYERRNYGPDRVAKHIVTATAKNRAVVPVAPEAAALQALSRFTPGLLREAAKLDPR